MIEHLRSLAVFARTVSLGSFRAAARDLSLSPSVVSHHVAALEAHVGHALLYRSTRRLSLTPDGERLYEAAQAMVSAASRGLDAVQRDGPALSGSLRVTAPAFLAETRLSRDIAGFCTVHPRVKLAVSFSDTPRDLLRDGFDLALRAGTLADSALQSRKLAVMHRLLVCAPAYRDGRPVAHVPQDLAPWDYLQLSSRRAEVSLARGSRAKPVTVGFQPRVSVDSAGALREMVLAGIGMATLPEVTVRDDLARGRMVKLLQDWHLPALGVHALWPANAQRPLLTLRFLDHLAVPVATLFTPATETPAHGA